jgi:hypothetical protein
LLVYKEKIFFLLCAQAFYIIYNYKKKKNQVKEKRQSFRDYPNPNAKIGKKTKI